MSRHGLGETALTSSGLKQLCRSYAAIHQPSSGQRQVWTLFQAESLKNLPPTSTRKATLCGQVMHLKAAPRKRSSRLIGRQSELALMQASSIKRKALTSMANASPILMSSEESCILTVCKPSVGKAVFLPSLASALRLNLAVVHDSVPAMKRKEAIFRERVELVLSDTSTEPFGPCAR